MVWFDKSEGVGPQAVNVRDGQLTKRGAALLFRLRATKERRGTLTFHSQAQLEELTAVEQLVPISGDTGHRIHARTVPLPGAGFFPRGCSASARYTKTRLTR
jgi:hypothetical protein